MTYEYIINRLTGKIVFVSASSNHASKVWNRIKCDAVVEALESLRIVAADECASCQKIIECIAEVLHNQTTDKTAAQAYLNGKPIYGAVGDMEMRSAAKVLRHVATILRVRELNLLEGKL